MFYVYIRLPIHACHAISYYAVPHHHYCGHKLQEAGQRPSLHLLTPAQPSHLFSPRPDNIPYQITSDVKIR